MKSVNVLVAAAGFAAAQTITADIAAIQSAVVALNSQVSAFSQAAQATAIVDSSQNIVSLINKGTSDAKAEGTITGSQAGNLLTPFEDLASAVSAVVNNLIGRKALATSLTLGNVVEAQLVAQLSAAQAFASAVEAQLTGAFVAVGSSLAANIIDELESGTAAFAGLSGPSTLGGSSPATTPASTPVSTSTSGSSVSTSVSSVSTSVAVPPGYTSSTSVTMSSGTGSAPTSTTSSNGTVSSSPPSTSSVMPSQGGADKAMAGFFSVAGAALLAMVAL